MVFYLKYSINIVVFIKYKLKMKIMELKGNYYNLYMNFINFIQLNKINFF